MSTRARSQRWIPARIGRHGVAVVTTHGYRIHCGFDADEAGDAAAREMITTLPSTGCDHRHCLLFRCTVRNRKKKPEDYPLLSERSRRHCARAMKQFTRWLGHEERLDNPLRKWRLTKVVEELPARPPERDLGWPSASLDCCGSLQRSPPHRTGISAVGAISPRSIRAICPVSHRE